MAFSDELTDKIKRTVEELPYEKQREVYDFAEYLRSKVKRKTTTGRSLADLVGIIEGPENMAATHDSIYDE